MAKTKKTINASVEKIDSVIKEDFSVSGIVSDCFKLNIRKKPQIDAEIVAVAGVLSELKVDMNKSSDDWYHVMDTNCNSGYCMKQYVTLR